MAWTVQKLLAQISSVWLSSESFLWHRKRDLPPLLSAFLCEQLMAHLFSLAQQHRVGFMLHLWLMLIYDLFSLFWQRALASDLEIKLIAFQVI